MSVASERADRAPEPQPPALVCVPGLGLDARAWAPTLSRLGVGSRAVAPLPGYGARPRGDALDPRALGRRLAAERLGGRDPVVLMGHSASCQIVVEAARAEPDAVAAIVLVGPTLDPRAATWPRIAQRWLRTAAHEDPRQVPVLVRTYSRVGLLHMLRTMDAARAHDIRTPIAALGCPVLVLRGRDDRICPADWAADLAGRAPSGSRAVTLPTGAHMVPLTRGRESADAVRAFLGRP